MDYLKMHLLLILLTVTFSFCSESCQKGDTRSLSLSNSTDSLPLKDSSITGKPAPAPPSNTGSDPAKMSFEIEFSAPVSKVKAAVADLKYNKAGWVSLEWDDNSLGAIQAMSLVKSKSYTDGCGNPVPYTAALAAIGRSQYNNTEMGLMPDYYTSYSQMKQLIALGWDIENHSYYHDPTGNYNYGTDWAKNISEMDRLILQKIQYKMNGAVVPTNYAGFATAAKNFGYLFSTSQGTFDQLLPGMGDYKSVELFSLAPLNFSSFKRIFYDDWSQMETDVNRAITDISSRTSAYFRFASHTVDLGALGRILNYFNTTTHDKILFLPTREVMEYRVMSKLPITYTTQNNLLKVTIDISSIPDRFRWRDLSFMVSSDSKINTIKNLNGIDRATFNAATGLVNIFKQVTTWK